MPCGGSGHRSCPATWAGYGAGILTLGVFLIDLRTPVDFAVFLGYIPAALLVVLTGRRAAVSAVTALAVILTLVGMVLSPPALPGTPTHYVFVHRALALFSIVASGWLSVFMIGLVNKSVATHWMLDMAGDLGKLGGWQIDLKARRVHWSDQVARIHGRAPGYAPAFDDALGAYAPEHRALMRRCIDECIAHGTPFAHDVQIVTPAGVTRWVRSVGRADGRGPVVEAVQGALQDIDERKAIETQLRQSLASWHSLAESMPMMVWTANADGVVDYVNQPAARYAGKSAGDLLAAGWLDLVHPADREAAIATWSRAVAARGPSELQYRLRRHDGAYRWHLTRAACIPDGVTGIPRWYGSSVDIDDQVRLQQEASTLAERLTATMESVGDAILSVDGGWQIVVMNKRAAVLLDRERSDLMGMQLWTEFPGGAGAGVEKECRRCVEQQVAVRFEEYFPSLKKYFEINAYPTPDGLTMYFRDVSHHRLLEKQMIEAQKLESLGRLTGGVAHDFNNLLTIILGNAEMLLEQSAPGAAGHMLADMIFGAAERGADMTRRLLAFARKQVLEPVPADLNRLVSGTDQLLRHTIGGHIEIEMVRGAGLWTTLVDPGQLESALLNLAINARDAMPDGGRLTIETANARLDESYAAQHNGVEPGQYVMLAVSDSGTGIAPELLPRVFEPFFTTKPAGHGTGLGLAMVYGFVKQSRGHIAIYSELDRGTTVKIYLPRLLGAERPPAPVGSAELVDSGDNQLILLTEDDAMVRQYARSQLEELGYRVIEAASGAEALEQLRARADIDLLFTDVVMPGGMSGRQLADAAHLLHPELPVLYTSGYTENSIVHHGRLDPGVILLSKPYRRAELAQKVSAALRTAGDMTRLEMQ